MRAYSLPLWCHRPSRLLLALFLGQRLICLFAQRRTIRAQTSDGPQCRARMRWKKAIGRAGCGTATRSASCLRMPGPCRNTSRSSCAIVWASLIRKSPAWTRRASPLRDASENSSVTSQASMPLLLNPRPGPWTGGRSSSPRGNLAPLTRCSLFGRSTLTARRYCPTWHTAPVTCFTTIPHLGVLTTSSAFVQRPLASPTSLGLSLIHI